MAHSSPEGIILDKGNKLVSYSLKINKEEVIKINKIDTNIQGKLGSIIHNKLKK